MMKFIFFVLLSGKLMSCSNSQPTNQSNFPSSDSVEPLAPKVDEKSSTNLGGCYMKIIGRDTAILMLEQKGAALSGKMLYDNYEKDGSRGTVQGKEEGDILKLWYDFNAEGMRSVMEVYFKKENGRLLRGIGDMDVKTDTTYFTTGINYSDKEAFSKVDCEMVEWKLKF